MFCTGRILLTYGLYSAHLPQLEAKELQTINRDDGWTVVLYSLPDVPGIEDLLQNIHQIIKWEVKITWI